MSHLTQHTDLHLWTRHTPKICQRNHLHSVTLPWHSATICFWQNMLLTQLKLDQAIPFLTLKKPLRLRIIHQPDEESGCSIFLKSTLYLSTKLNSLPTPILKRISSYTGFPLLFSVYTWWCIMLPITQSLVDTCSFGHKSSKITQGGHPQWSKQQTCYT